MGDSKLQKYTVKLDRANTNFTLQLFEYFKNAKWGHEYDFLKYYQNIVRKYVNEIDLDSRGLLVVHTMGMGKSILAISIAIDLMKERQPIILLTKSLQENMRGSIVKYIRLRAAVEPDYPLGRLNDIELADWISHNFSFVSMNASNMLQQLGKAAEGHTAEEFDIALEKKFGEVLKIASLDGKLLIVDEAHNLFRAITNGSKNAIGLYDLVMKSRNLKVMFFTGTPIANDPFELVPCFNMLGSRYGKPILPESYKDFNKLYVDGHGGIKNKNKFQNRIFGLVSHIGRETQPGKAFGLKDASTVAEFPTELPVVVERVHMDPDQYVMYQLARDKEKEEGTGKAGGPSNRIVETASLTKPKSQAASTYRVKSRQLSNFCPPPGLQDATVETIPEQYLGSAKYRKVYQNITKHNNQLGLVYSQFVGMGGLGTFSRFLESQGWVRIVDETKNAKDVDLNENYTLGGASYSYYGSYIPPADTYLRNIEENLEKHGSGWLSKTFTAGGDELDLLDQLDVEYVVKYASDADIPSLQVLDKNFPARFGVTSVRAGTNTSTSAILMVLSEGKLIGYVVMENGAVAAEYFNTDSRITKRIKKAIHEAITGGSNYKKIRGGVVDVSNIRKKRFAIISGDVTVESRTNIQEMFNRDDNKEGGLIDLVLVSSTGAEGLDLKNVRHIHVMEPYWNWGRVQQIIARGVRNDSHKALPADKKNVQPYIYLAVPPESERKPTGEYPATTDTELYDESIANQVTIESFNDALKEVSIECLANGEEGCRVCNPDNTPLFSADPARDARASDPCSSMQESNVIVKEIIVGDDTYYFSPDPSSIYDYKIYVYDSTIDGYRPLPESDPKYIIVIDAINAIELI